MTTKITRIGNSRGIRIPTALLDLYGLEEESQVELIWTSDGILLRRSPAGNPTKLSWKEAYGEFAHDEAAHAEWIEWDATAVDGLDAPADR